MIFFRLLAQFVSDEIGAKVRDAERSVIFVVLAGAAIVVGAGFFVGAGYIAAAERYGAIEAALGFGCGFVVAAVFLIVIQRVAARRAARRQKARRRSELKSMGTSLVVLLPALLSRKSMLGLAIPLIGYFIYRENFSGGDDEPDPET